MAGTLRRGAESVLRRWWAGHGGAWSLPLSAVGAPAAVLYGWAVRLRTLGHDRGLLGAAAPALPVVSVGNLSVGGTGKTPLAGWIVELLKGEGRRPAVVSRGYGADELLLHSLWHPDVPVIARRRRSEGVEAAAAAGADVAVLDDGFQHRSLERHLDVVALSPADPFPPRLLPRGPYREPLSALRRADLLLVTAKGTGEEGSARALVAELRRSRGLPAAHLFPLAPAGWTDLAGAEVPSPRGPVLAVASIAQPRGFAALLRERGLDGVDLLAFPDHHPYDAGDVSRIRARAGGRPVVTTEKDAVKLMEWRDALPGAVVLVLRPDPPPETVQAVRGELRRILAAGAGEAGRP